MKVLLKIYKSARAYWGFIFVAAVTMLALTGLNLVVPRLTSNMVRVLEGFEPGVSYVPDEMARITTIALMLLGVFIFRTIMQFLQGYISHYGAWKFLGELRAKVYGHLQSLSVGYYHDKQTGELMSRVINDTNAFEQLIAHAVPDLASSVILFVSVTIILFTNNPVLAALTCIPIPFILLTTPLIRKIREKHREAQILVAELNSKLQDNFSGIKEIQIFNREGDEFAGVSDKSAKHASALIKALFYSAIIHPLIALLSSLGHVIVIGVGGYLVLNNHGMAIADVTEYLLYLAMFYGPVAGFARIIEDMQAGIAGGERVFAILESVTEIREKENAAELPRVSGGIKFENVTFQYNNNEVVLKDVGFEIPPRQMFALVGPTGVGKTTMAALIPRFYDTTQGSIKIDGHDLRDVTLKSLRDNISMVLQDVFLFNGTIRDNIVYGKPDATDDEVIKAAKMARIHEFVDSLPLKYETVVGERGVRLSGGQKQRIAIARALLCESPVLILDEATSSVDTETEREIQEAIQQIAGSRTLIVIAHRLSTVKRADSILVLEDGEVREQGSHDELIAKGGAYKRLVDIQSITV